MRVRGLIAGGVAVAAAVAGLVLPGASQPASAAGSIRTSVSLVAPKSGVYNSVIKLTGTVWRTGTSTKLRGVAVYLQRSAHGKNRFATVSHVRTSATGTYAFSVRQLSAYDYRTYFAGTSRYRAAYSPVRYPYTSRYLSLDSISTTDANNGVLRATGHALPAPAVNTPVYLQQYSAAKAWVTIATARTVSGGKVTIDATRPGSQSYYRLVIGQAYPYGPGITPAKLFAHYVWRGAFTEPALAGGDGTFTFPSAAEDPRRSAFYLQQDVQTGGAYIFPNTLGCVAMRANTSNHAPGGPTDITMTAKGQQPTTVRLAKDDNLGLSLATPLPVPAGESSASEQFSLVGTSNSLFGILELRCAN
ncbi:hypothetical protein [Kribbella sp. NPDC004536]|uniref:hypothetical protein n=1 Tax=Kribbella sp. NPDC004536 TaxID=3364106 RepID=UPI0036B31041